MVRAEGSLTSGVLLEVESGVLDREVEWRQLPSDERELSGRLENLSQQQQALQARFTSLQQRMTPARERTRSLRETLDRQTSEAAAIRQSLQQSIQIVKWQNERIAEIKSELASLTRREGPLKEDIQSLKTEEIRVLSSLTQVEEQQRRTITSETEMQRQRLEEARTILAVAQEALNRQRIRLDEYRDHSQLLTQQLQRLESRATETIERLASLQMESRQLARSEQEYKGELTQLIEQQQPIQETLTTGHEGLEAVLNTESTLQQRLRLAESQANRSSSDATRVENELTQLQERIFQDLDLGESPHLRRLQMDEGLVIQPPLPLDPVVASLPEIVQLPEGLEKKIRLIRSQLRRHGQVNPQAPLEYDELRERHTFLVNQASDLRTAENSLRQVIVELDHTMESRFLSTFEAVSAKFTEYFALLFEGGHGQLVFTEPQKPSQTGVDIRARPPGKRDHRLELLSGGERALAALALVFAILTVSPTPFCLLDEVDAMLDEANARRFRRLLEQLAEHTQFIVITHNRQTVEAAGCIYGISMDENGVSQAISLRLEEVSSMVGL